MTPDTELPISNEESKLKAEMARLKADNAQLQSKCDNLASTIEILKREAAECQAKLKIFQDKSASDAAWEKRVREASKREAGTDFFPEA